MVKPQFSKVILNFSWARIWQCLCICVSVCPKTLGHAGDFKNCRVWLKFCTLVCWVNIWGLFFIFWKFWFLGSGDEFFAKMRLKLWSSLETSKIVVFGWNSAHLFLGWISGVFFSFFKNLIFGALGRVFRQNEAKTLGHLETSKMVGFGWDFAHLFLGCISGGIFSFFKNFDFCGLGTSFLPKRG